LVPQLATHYKPSCDISLQEAIAFRSTFSTYTASNHGLTVQFMPDEVHFVTDTIAIIMTTNSNLDFISDIQPIQQTVLKRIRSGLAIKGIGDAEYTFRTDDGSYTTVTLQ
jgi:hypothetical protein